MRHGASHTMTGLCVHLRAPTTAGPSASLPTVPVSMQVTVAECAATNGHHELDKYLSGMVQSRKEQLQGQTGGKCCQM